MALIKTPPIIYPDFGSLLTYRESVKSATAIRKGIDNTPSVEQYQNMVKVYHQVILPLFLNFGKLPISSFFRSPALNKAIGGAKTSAHMMGQAVDIDCDGMRTVTNKAVFDWVRANLDFDQLILESPDKFNNPSWVHVAYKSPEINRHQCLRMVWQNGKQIYETI